MNSYDAICYVCGKPVRNVSGGVAVHPKCAEAEQKKADERYDERIAYAIRK